MFAKTYVHGGQDTKITKVFCDRGLDIHGGWKKIRHGPSPEAYSDVINLMMMMMMIVTMMLLQEGGGSKGN